MFKSIFTLLMSILTLTGCTQPSPIVHSKKGIKLIPFLTKNNNYSFVDEMLVTQIKEEFPFATAFTKTGFAVVGNVEEQSAVINTEGKYVIPYASNSIYLMEVQDLTLLVQETNFTKKLPFWKWDWNIMSSHIKTEALYKQLVVRVLETGQVLFDGKMPEDASDYNFTVYPVADNSIVWNGDLYTIENKKFNQVKRNIELVLDKGRYIPASNNTFEIWELKDKKPILCNLIGKTELSVTIDMQEFVIDSINQERYVAAVPKVLYDTKTKNSYVYPQYDKAFPKQIQVKNEEQAAFLKEASLIYSINNSPYFILGRFNYDHEVWAYDWLYLDQKGDFYTEVPTLDFFITDQVGYTLWPSASMVIPGSQIEKGWKLDKIRYVQESRDLFIVRLKDTADTMQQYGLWNRKDQKWEIQPSCAAIDVLDQQRHLYAIQEVKNGPYRIFNNKLQKQVGDKQYESIYSSGLVKASADDKPAIYFYVDLSTGKEYRETE